MKFRSNFPWDSDIEQFSECGSEFQDIWELCPDAKTEHDIRISKTKKHLQAEIDSYKDLCDINKILERFTNGDITAIGNPNDMRYGDLSNIPDNIQELSSNVKAAYDVYNSLPEDVKSKFDGINDFYASIGTEKFNNIILKSNETEINEASDEAVV